MLIAAAAALALSLAAGERAPAGQTAAPDATPAPVSVERVREGVERPQLLKLPHPDEIAYFRATVEEALPVDGVLDAMRRDLAAWPGSPIIAPTSGHPSPAVGIEVLGLARSFLRARAERKAKRAVRIALDEFCLTHDCSTVESGPAIEGVLMPRAQRVAAPSP